MDLIYQHYFLHKVYLVGIFIKSPFGMRYSAIKILISRFVVLLFNFYLNPLDGFEVANKIQIKYLLLHKINYFSTILYCQFINYII